MRRMARKLRASRVAEDVARFAVRDLASGKSCQNVEELLGDSTGLDKDQSLKLTIWLLSHALMPARNLFEENVRLIVQGEALRTFAAETWLELSWLVDTYFAFQEYFDEHYSRESPFASHTGCWINWGLRSQRAIQSFDGAHPLCARNVHPDPERLRGAL